MKSNNKIISCNRKSAFTELSEFCHFAIGEKGKSYWVETTEWSNGEGFDLEIENIRGTTRVQLTWGEWDAMKACVKIMIKQDAN